MNLIKRRQELLGEYLNLKYTNVLKYNFISEKEFQERKEREMELHEMKKNILIKYNAILDDPNDTRINQINFSSL